MKNSTVMWGVGGAIAFIAIAASGLLFLREPCRDFKEGRLQVNGQDFFVSVADAQIERTTGLAGCKSIPNKSGMYFPYEAPQPVSFWMKGMVIPIDIIWVAQGKVVGIEENVPVIGKLTDDPPIYRPPQPVHGVLEVGAGQAQQLGIAIGSTINYLP